MNYDEFAFFNRQLAGMLKDGIPLEGALRQLCQTMQSGRLRSELEQLERDLAKGTPFKDALAARQLPSFYCQMIQVGVRSNNLVEVLILLADYYQRAQSIRLKLKGLMVYPLLVLGMALAVSVLICIIFNTLGNGVAFDFLVSKALPPAIGISLLLPPVLLTLAFIGVVAALATPRLRRAMNWRLPGFQEASLSQLASAGGLILKNGGNLQETLGLLQSLEQETPAGAELGRWQQRLGQGHGKFADVAEASKVFPPLFIWLIASNGENLAEGFKQAAEIYYARATHKVDMLLYAALPVSILLLGVMIISQIMPALQLLVSFMNTLGSMGD
jgi:type IV pilus assembly protein PilC